MNPDKIRFNCPSCGIQLDVPASLAGVTGPCPSCQSSITAPLPQASSPFPEPEPAPPVQSAPPQPAYQPEPAQPTSTPVQPQQPVYYPEPSYPEPSPAPQQPIPQLEAPPQYSQPEPIQPQSPAGQNVFPTAAPEPIQAQVHATPDDHPFPIEQEPVIEPLEQLSPDQYSSQNLREAPTHLEQAQSGQAPSPTKQSSRIPSLLFLLAMLILMTVIVVGILNATGVVGLDSLKRLFGFEKPQTSEEVNSPPPPTQNQLIPQTPSQPEPITSPDTLNLPDTPAIDGSGALPPVEPATENPDLGLPDGEDYREGESPLPVGLKTNTNDPKVIQETLESFLNAQNLEERRPFLSTASANNPEVAKTLLAGPIPKPITIHYRELLNDEQEKRTDFFYAVSWDGANNSPTKPIMVELHKWSESEPPQVQSEAFLEFYQQRLVSYASAPQDSPARFFVFAKCVPRCFESEEVHDYASKATLKLASFPNDRTAVKAYFDKKGEIYEKLQTYQNGLAFRREIPLTITLEWSNPEFEPRFLEVRILNSFDWHP